MLPTTANIVQGSISSRSGVVCCQRSRFDECKTVSSNNRLVKYADDTYLVIPASNVETRAAELDHIEQCSGLQSITFD